MKKQQKKTKRQPKLMLAKESVRKLADPDLSHAAGGGEKANGATVTFPKCCLTI